MMTSFLIVLLLAPRVIPALKRLKFGQEVREDGPQSHLKKQGTPTMGGVLFLSSVTAASLLGMSFSGGWSDGLKILFLALSFGLIGMADDYLKIRKHQSEGLKARQKFLLQLAAALIFVLWLTQSESAGTPGTRVLVPFTGQRGFWDMPVWLFVPFALFVILGTDNGVNFTDGLDGLCSSVTAVVAAFFALVGLLSSRGTMTVSAAVLGGLLGFLLFNAYPAKVFMGDTGSLFLGGFVAGAACVSGTELYVPIVGFIYMIEVISVIIQVGYFKKTHGKRFFKMAPIHHHFELCGNSETQVVTAFSIVTIILCILAAGGYIR